MHASEQKPTAPSNYPSTWKHLNAKWAALRPDCFPDLVQNQSSFCSLHSSSLLALNHGVKWQHIFAHLILTFSCLYFAPWEEKGSKRLSVKNWINDRWQDELCYFNVLYHQRSQSALTYWLKCHVRSAYSLKWMTGKTNINNCVSVFRCVTDVMAIMRWMSPCSHSRWCTSASRSRKESCRNWLKNLLLKELSQLRNMRYSNLHRSLVIKHASC